MNKQSSGNRKRSDFFHFAAADACDTNLHPLVCSIVIHIDGLDVGFKHTGRNFHHVHTDSAFFLRKTPADDSCTIKLFLAADFTDIAH